MHAGVGAVGDSLFESVELGVGVGEAVVGAFGESLLEDAFVEPVFRAAAFVAEVLSRVVPGDFVVGPRVIVAVFNGFFAEGDTDLATHIAEEGEADAMCEDTVDEVVSFGGVWQNVDGGRTKDLSVFDVRVEGFKPVVARIFILVH